MKIIELFTDPSSNQLSASRFLLLLFVLFGIPILIYLICIKMLPIKETTSLITAIIASLAGIYGANSFGGALRRGILNTDDKKESNNGAG